MSNEDQQDPEQHERLPVHLTEDEEPLEIETHELTMSEILALVGKKPDKYYLVEKVGREQRQFREPDEEIHIKEGAEFIAVALGPAPVS